MLLGGLRRQHGFAAAADGIPLQWRELRALGRLPGQVGGTAYGVICGADAAGFEYMCAVEVAALEPLPREYGRLRLLQQHYAVFQHVGPVTGIRGTWERVFKWLAGSGFESAHKPDFEVYGSNFAPDSGLGGAEIWLAVVRRGSRADPD